MAEEEWACTFLAHSLPNKETNIFLKSSRIEVFIAKTTNLQPRYIVFYYDLQKKVLYQTLP